MLISLFEGMLRCDMHDDDLPCHAFVVPGWLLTT